MLRELMYAAALGSVYGNSQLDAKKGWEYMQNAMDRARDCIPYLMTHAGVSTQDRMIEVMKKLESIPREAWKEEFDRRSGDHEEEVHVLGGKHTGKGPASKGKM